MSKKLTHFKKGFTLVETMVAISILMLAILGPLSIAAAGLRNSAYARDQITAYYLAQEAIEFARDKRDDNYFKNFNNPSTPISWLYGLNTECSSTGGCVLDSLEWFKGNPPTKQCNATAVPDDCGSQQMYVTTDGYYTYETPTGAIPARYKRIIKITPVSGSSDEVTVTAYMSWTAAGGAQKSFQLTENMFNIYKN